MTETEKTDAKISEKLAKIVENRWLNKLSDGQFKEKTERYLRPANCDNFITPKVNPEIWERLDRQTRGRDLKLSTLQSTTTKVGYICTKATELLLQARRENKSPDIEQLIRMHTDALGLLGHISFEISQRRRDAIRPNLNKEYATLCASHVPITKMLFGDELQTQLNHIRASNKISNTTSRFALHKYWQEFFRENLSDEPAEQPRSEQPELPPKEKRSQRSEVTTTGIISQLDSPQVRDNFESFLPILLEYFREKMLSFKAGRLAAHFSQWQSLTSDPEILETVSGCKIEFDTIPRLNKVMVHAVLSETQTESVDTEVSNLLRKQATEACDHEAGEYISPIFTRPKKDRSHRMILNLKSLNKHITHHHFKMDTVLTAVRLMKPGCFMASIDLKDACYSVSIHSDFQKYLKFSWRGQLYKFVCFPNGLAPCPRQFTKLLKPVFSMQPQKTWAHLCCIYR